MIGRKPHHPSNLGPLFNTSNLRSNKRSRSRRIHLVVPVLSSDNNTVITDVIAVMADDLDLRSSDRAKRLVTVGVTESNHYQKG
jgi:hypothetical protein